MYPLNYLMSNNNNYLNLYNNYKGFLFLLNESPKATNKLYLISPV